MGTHLRLAALFSGFVLVIGYGIPRHQFVPLISLYAAFFVLYWWLVTRHIALEAAEWWIRAGLLFRGLLLFSAPLWSDDIYRFLWDGYLLNAGIDPFAHAPQYYFDTRFFPGHLSNELFQKLNSPQYYSVYPPVAQALFSAVAWLSCGQTWAGVLIFKCLLLTSEYGVLYLLKKPWPQAFLPGQKMAILYALNPLVILEISGNAHFETLMIFSLIAGLRALANGKEIMAAVFCTLAIATKLVPVLLLPLWFRSFAVKKGWRFMAATFITGILIFIPVLNGYLHMLKSVELYFSTFALNGSLFFVFRFITAEMHWWGLQARAGVVLGGITLLAIAGLSWRLRAEFSFQKKMAFFTAAWCIYLINSAVVHPWYVTVPFALSLFTPFRTPLWWTGLVVLSYSHYAVVPWRENFWLTGLEYALLFGFAVGEFYFFKKAKNAASPAL